MLSLDAPNLSHVVAGLMLIAVALMLRRSLEVWLADPHRWALVSRLNDLAMPVFLWHMTAYLLAALALGSTGFVWGTHATAEWWRGRPVMVAGAAFTLAVLLALIATVRRLTADDRTRSGRTVPK